WRGAAPPFRTSPENRLRRRSRRSEHHRAAASFCDIGHDVLDKSLTARCSPSSASKPAQFGLRMSLVSGSVWSGAARGLHRTSRVPEARTFGPVEYARRANRFFPESFDEAIQSAREVLATRCVRCQERQLPDPGWFQLRDG